MYVYEIIKRINFINKKYKRSSKVKSKAKQTSKKAKWIMLPSLTIVPFWWLGTVCGRACVERSPSTTSFKRKGSGCEDEWQVMACLRCRRGLGPTPSHRLANLAWCSHSPQPEEAVKNLSSSECLPSSPLPGQWVMMHFQTWNIILFAQESRSSVFLCSWLQTTETCIQRLNCQKSTE